MKKTAIALALFAASTAQAGTFWHPEASSVIATGPNSITVCQWWPSPFSFQPEVWACEEILTFGAKDVPELQLQRLGPVKVFAKWAYARDATGALVPMVKE
jgi:hypothetical protein